MSETIKVGCCGFPVGKERYFKEFSLVELQQTFYQMPDKKLAMKWRSEAPEDFEFTVKAWQLITHPPTSFTYKRLKEKIPESKKDNYGFFKPTKEVFDALDRTLEICEILKCEILLFQTPASFKPEKDNIKNFIDFFTGLRKENKKMKLAWEPRGEWEEEEIKRLCKKFDIVHCVDPMVNKSVYGDFSYFRLHGSYEGGRINYKYKYADKELKELNGFCDKKLNYVLFNNIYMFEDALRFKKAIRS